MPHPIHDWQDISARFSDNLLIGNGASIAVSDSFNYNSLKEKAEELRLFTRGANALFLNFGTSDFELILRLVWHAYKVNLTLEIEDPTTTQVYNEVRRALIETVRHIHPAHAEISDNFRPISDFCRSFDNVFSLNYDLILYWSTLWSNDSGSNHRFKDCFAGGGRFREDWRSLREPVWPATATTLVFYPHGNLFLSRDIREAEHKLSAQGHFLLERILSIWNSASAVPLFVSEGTVEQKKNAILGSPYLSTVYRECINEARESLTVYGWGFGEHDRHILKAFSKSSIRRLAVSASNNAQGQAYCNRVRGVVDEIFGPQTEVLFFDRGSRGAWNNPVQPRR